MLADLTGQNVAIDMTNYVGLAGAPRSGVAVFVFTAKIPPKVNNPIKYLISFNYLFPIRPGAPPPCAIPEFHPA